MSDGFGNSNYDKNSKFKKKNYFNISDSPQVFAILPPMFSNAEKGRWSEFFNVHFGYKNSEGKLRTFVSPQVKNPKTKMIDVPDAALNRINDLKARLEAAKTAKDEALVARLNELVGQKGMYNLDKNWHMNVHTLDGKIGILKMRHRCKQALDAEIEKLRAAGVDPNNLDQGRYFVFTRIGTGPDTTFKVDVYQEEVDVPGFGKMKREAVRNAPAELRARALSGEAADLTKLFQTVTEQECAEIVAQSNLVTGISPACDKIFDERWKAARNGTANTSTAAATNAKSTTAGSASSDPSDEEPDSDPAPAPASTGPANAAPVAATPAAAPVAAETKAAPTSAPATPANTPSFEHLDDDAFFAAIGAPKAG